MVLTHPNIRITTKESHRVRYESIQGELDQKIEAVISILEGLEHRKEASSTPTTRSWYRMLFRLMKEKRTTLSHYAPTQRIPPNMVPMEQ